MEESVTTQSPAGEGELHSPDGENISRFVVRLRGIPWTATTKDVAAFFADLQEVDESKVHIIREYDGRNTGQCLVELESEEVRDRSVAEKQRQYIGDRYVEVYRSTDDEVCNLLKRRSNGSHDSSGNSKARPGNPGSDIGGQEVVRLRGLPFSATEYQVQRFFEDSGFSIETHLISIGFYPDGRLTGEAWVLVDNAEECIAKMNKQNMGRRYIEMFQSTKHEFEMSKRGVQSSGSGRYGGGMPSYNSSPYGHAPQTDYNSWNQSPNSYDQSWNSNPETHTSYPNPTDLCLRMRGLPYHADENNIVEFFKTYHLKAILPSTVPINSRPSGEAYVEFHNTDEANRAFRAKNGGMMDRRYIELFMCSKQEMDWAAEGMDPREIRKRLQG